MLPAAFAALLVLFFPARTYPQAGAAALPVDPICGYLAGPHIDSRAAEVKRGLCVDLLAGQAQAGQPLVLRFFVNRKPHNTPEDNLQIEHEKFMHLFGVREDLREFFHVHPVKTESGLWEVPYTFAKGGRYKLWADIKAAGTTYSFSQPMVTVRGDAEAAADNPTAEPTNAVVSGYEVQWIAPEQLIAGETNQFRIAVRNREGGAAELENYLAAPMHLAVLKDDLSQYIHAHPQRAGKGRVNFQQSFARPGRYKIFAQFRPAASSLAKDDSLLAVFSIDVQDKGVSLSRH